MMLFKLMEKVGGHKVAPHFDDKGNEVKPGDVVESDRDLEVLFRNKFERVPETLQGPTRKPKIPIPSPVAISGESKGGESTATSLTSPGPDDDEVKDKYTEEYGKNVTSQFPIAKEVEMSVYEKAHWFTVIDPADGEVMNEKKLREKEVDEFLEQYREEG